MNNLPSVAIVILNYNGQKYLEKFLPSVLASTYSNLQIIVADNASTDDSIKYLQTNFSEIEIISLSQNYGFAEGYNQALKQVEAAYYVLLNSDIEVSPQWIEPVITLMSQDESIAVCQPKILAYQQKGYFEYAGAAGGYIDYLGYPFARGRIFDTLERDQNQYQESKHIFWASGAAMFVKSNVYKELEGLYAYFFAHQEEIDFCWRAQLTGYKIACCTQSTVYHVGGGTLPKGHRKTFLNFRNNLIMLSRNLSKQEKRWKLPLRLVLDGVFALKCAFSLDFVSVKAIWKAHIAFYKWCLQQENSSTVSTKEMQSLSGVYAHSIIGQYYIRQKKYFKDLEK